MVKRKLKQTTGNLTVVVNVGGVPTKKVRKKRGKSRARGGGSVRPAKNFVVSYTDQTPTLNLLKEFSETNRLLLTGQNNLMLEAPAAPARIAAQTSDPSVMGTAYSIDTTHKYDRPRPNRLAPEPPAPDPPAPSAPARPAQGRQAAESQDLSGFRKLASHFRGRKERGKPSYPQIIHTTKEEYERDIMRREDRPWSPSRKMPPVPPRPKKMETTGTNTPPVLPPRPPPNRTTTGTEMLPQRPPPNMTTTGAETLPQRPPPNRTIGTQMLPQRPPQPPPKMTTTGTEMSPPNTTTTGTEMLPPPKMTTTGTEALPDQRLSQLTEAVVAGAGQVKLTKAELKKTKAELAKAKQREDLAFIDRQQFEQESAFQSGLVRKEMETKLKETSEQLTQANEELERMKTRPVAVRTNVSPPRPRMPQRPPPNRSTQFTNTESPPNMVSRGEETLPPLPSMDPVFAELTTRRQAREFAMESGKTKAQLRQTEKKLKETLDDLGEEKFNVELGEKAMKIYTDERDKARAELQRTKNQLTEAEAGRRNAQNKGFYELELEKQARRDEQKESSQILTRTKEELERMKMSSQDVKALPAKPANLAQLKSLASMKAETDKFMEISRQARFSMDREYRASQASRDSLDFSNIQQINERQLFEIRQRRTMEPVSQRNLLNVDALSSLPKSRLSALVEQNIAREDELQRLEVRSSLDELPSRLTIRRSLSSERVSGPPLTRPASLDSVRPTVKRPPSPSRRPSPKPTRPPSSSKSKRPQRSEGAYL